MSVAVRDTRVEADEPMVEPHIIPRSEHCVSRNHIDGEVLKVLYRLKKLGHEAYVVGGAIRDMLRGKLPKDFDVATDATPSQLRKIFRNSRVVGRRFKLVHVIFGGHMVEVATLRRAVGDDPDDEDYEDEDDLYIEDDNLWGDVESDAFRRDFTINALFYDITDFSIIDYVGGVDDLRDGLIRSIGDPWTRLREDPVRMLRAIKFAARFGYAIEPETDAAMHELPEEIHNASRFRVTEESFRIITQRHRDRGFAMLDEYGFLEALFPGWLKLAGTEGVEQVCHYLQRVDQEAENGRHLPVEMAAAGMFLPLLRVVDVEAMPYHERAAELAQEIRQLAIEMDLPKKLTAAVVTLLRGQLYLLYYAGREKQMRRFVRSHEFDWIWRLHDLAFGEIEELHPLQEAWLLQRERLPEAIDGWADGPDKRDIFSFRGKSGGGRRGEGEQVSVVEGKGGGGGGRRRRRSRSRRRKR